MFTLNTPVTDLIDICLAKANPCMEGPQSGILFLQSLPEGCTMEEMINHPDNQEKWFLWNIVNEDVYADFDSELRRRGLEYITIPAYAFHIYTTCSGLSDEEANILLPLVLKKPVLIQEVRDGIRTSVRSMPDIQEGYI